jgi:hypothetical protein
MTKLLISTAIAIVMLTASGFAKQEITVTRTVYDLSDFPTLEASAKAVCEGKAVLSPKLRVACKLGTFPSVTKAGKFRNTGIGAELNTLISQGD